MKKTKARDVDRFSGLEPTDLNGMEKRSVVLLAMNILSAKHRAGQLLKNPKETGDFLRLRMAEYRNEVFGALFLDTQHRILAVREIFQGTIDSASIYPRVVVQKALEYNASAAILYHNHPSGVAEPSRADKTITKRLADALSMIDVRVLDHFVVSATESVSFAELGLI
jgi:DNA repair protein RadC